MMRVLTVILTQLTTPTCTSDSPAPANLEAEFPVRTTRGPIVEVDNKIAIIILPSKRGKWSLK